MLDRAEVGLEQREQLGVGAACQHFGDERAAIPVALSGGMLSRGSVLRKRFEHRLKSAVPGAQLRTDAVVAARGAVRAALRMLGEVMA